MRYIYEINDNLELRVWDTENPNENGAPFLFQPDWPNGTTWESREQVEAWANIYVEELSNPQSELLAGFSPEVPSIVRPK